MRGRAWLLLIAASLSATAAHAHGGAQVFVDGLTLTYDPWVVLPLYCGGVLYFFGTARLWARAGHGRGVRKRQLVCFWGAWLALALALISPLHWLGERLFVAHMLEHGILIGVAAPLMVLARPTGALLWGLPTTVRARCGAILRHPGLKRSWGLLVNPLVATAVSTAGLWVWHIPWLYAAALRSPGYHRLEHLTFTLTAMLFWWALLRRRRQGVNLFCLFATSMQTSVLGLLLTLSPRLLYPSQEAFASEWGLTPLEDQQLAGLLMWVPMGVIYTGAALWFAAQWITSAASGGPRVALPNRSTRPPPRVYPEVQTRLPAASYPIGASGTRAASSDGRSR